MCVCVADSPEVTHVGLRYLNSLSRLQYLILRDQLPYCQTDVKLQGLYNCSLPGQLELGRHNRQMQMSNTAAAVTGSVRLHTHRQL